MATPDVDLATPGITARTRAYGGALRRLVVNTLALLAVLAAGAIIVDAKQRSAQRAIDIRIANDSVERLQAELDVRAASASGSTVGAAYPDAVNPQWFDGDPPTNPLVGAARTWIETASSGDRSLQHPRNPTVEGGQGAMFWYNPALGIIRARVPRTLSDAEALELYNAVNGTHVDSLDALAIAGE